MISPPTRETFYCDSFEKVAATSLKLYDRFAYASDVYRVVKVSRFSILAVKVGELTDQDGSFYVLYNDDYRYRFTVKDVVQKYPEGL